MRATLLLLVLWGPPLFAGSVEEIFTAGETLDYNLHWMAISGGAARMTISPLDEERYRITSVGKSGTFFSRFFKVRDAIESIVDRDDFSTRQYRKILDERGRKKDELTVVDGDGNATRKGQSVRVPRPIFDPLSLVYHLRTFDLTPGKSHQFSVLSDGKLYDLTAFVLRRETISTPAGRFKTVVVEPKMESTAGLYRDEQNRLLIWYSDDERHIPVRIRSDLRIGSITVTLRAIRSGVSSTEPVTLRGQ